MPFFSIIIPVKNGKKLLQKCIDSVLSQTYSDYEIVVLTDTTTNDDGTLDYLNSLNVIQLRIEESPRQIGIQQNWGRILHLKKGEYFTILGYDDILYPDYLATMVDLINNNPDATLYQTHFDYIDQTGTVIKQAPQMPEKISGETYLAGVLTSKYPVIATGFVIRSSDYAYVGGVPVEYPNLLYADFELWLRLTFLGHQVISPKKCFAFRIHQSTTKVSSTRTTLQGMEHFIAYLKSLQSNPGIAPIIKENAPYFLKFHCNGVAFRVIRSKVKEQGYRVPDVVSAFERFAFELGIPDLNFKGVKTIKIALLIDRFYVSRKLYLWAKTVYSKPVIKSFID